MNIDHVYNWKNHLQISSRSGGRGYGSHIATYPLTFVVPAAADRTAATAFFYALDGNITAYWARKGVMWVSTEDDWFKFTKIIAPANDTGPFVEIEKDETTAKNGALPYAVTSVRGDTIFLTQDKQLQKITDTDLVQSDAIKLMSDEIALTYPNTCLLYTSPSPRDRTRSRMPSSA